MKRRTSTTPVRVYKYGLPFGPTKETAHLVEQQIRLAHRYRNALVAVERNKRVAFRQIIGRDEKVAELDARIAALTAQLDDEETRMSNASKKKRKRVVDIKGRTIVVALKQERKKARDARKKAVTAAKRRPDLKVPLALLEDRVKEWLRAEYKAAREAGLFWGTCITINKAMEQARKSKTDPDFRPARFYTEQIGIDGSIIVQLQNGCAVPLLFGSDSRVQIGPLPEDAWKGTRGEQMRRTRTPLRIRIGSNGREPIWAEFEDMNMHRPLPPDGVVKWVRVKRVRIGTRFRWECHVTVESESFRATPRPPSVTAAIDFGWRRVDEALRISRAMTEDGDSEDLMLPMSNVARQRYANHLQSIRDGHFDETVPLLAEWLAAHPHPPWLARATSNLTRWKSKNRLTRVAHRWMDNRFDGDAEIFELVDRWRRQERHLYHWECRQRSKAIGARFDFYRVTAKQWAAKYPRIVITTRLDFSETARRAAPGEAESEAPHVYRKEAAAGEFREALIMAVKAAGGEVVEVDVPADTCHACGELCKWDAEKYDHHTCEHCGTHWQCDDNMCHKLHAALSGEAPAPRAAAG